MKKSGAGDGIRTHDPNLGNFFKPSIRQHFFLTNGPLKHYYHWIFLAVTHTVGILFLPPETRFFCFPHASPAAAADSGEAKFGIHVLEQEDMGKMGKITKRLVDALGSKPNKDGFAWDSEMRGFGIRVKPSGAKTYLIQYRNLEGRTRRLVLGSCGVLTPEQARALARQKLAAVAEGADPSADRHAIRDGMTVADVCDWYLKEAGEGRLLGRNRRPIKASSLAMDLRRCSTDAELTSQHSDHWSHGGVPAGCCRDHCGCCSVSPPRTHTALANIADGIAC